jgi:heme/copper-type cytochrome/quinol oxidase subunit 2
MAWYDIIILCVVLAVLGISSLCVFRDFYSIEAHKYEVNDNAGSAMIAWFIHVVALIGLFYIGYVVGKP